MERDTSFIDDASSLLADVNFNLLFIFHIIFAKFAGAGASHHQLLPFKLAERTLGLLSSQLSHLTATIWKGQTPLVKFSLLMKPRSI